MASSSDTILEERIVVITPPLLAGMSKEMIYSFIKKYDRYKKLRIKEKSEVVPIADCIEPDLLELLKYREDKKIFESDDEMRLFLDSKSVYTESEEIVKAFDNLKMDMSIIDVQQRLAKYDMEFLAIHRRAAGFKLKDKTLISFYIEGLVPQAIVSYLKSRIQFEKMSLMELMAVAGEKIQQQQEMYVAAKSASKKESEKYRDHGSRREESTTSLHESKKKPGFYEKKDTRRSDDDKKASREERLKNITCFNCQKKGHYADNCPEKSGDHKPSSSTTHYRGNDRKNTNTESHTKHTHIKHEKAHLVVKESNDNNVQVDSDDSDDECTITECCMLSHEAVNDGLIRVPVKIAGIESAAIVDTGATCSCVSRGLAKKLPVTAAKDIAGTITLRMADGTVKRCTRISAVVELPVKVATALSVEWNWVVLPDDRDIILLGTDILRNVGLLDEDKLLLPLKAEMGKNRQEYKEKYDEDDIDADPADWCDARVCLTQPISSILDEIQIPKSVISRALRKEVEESAEIFSPTLPVEGADIGRFKIELNSDEVIAQKARTLHPEMRAKVEGEIEKLEEAGIIRDSSSPYASNIVPVKKKGTDEVRICVDYRALNKITVSDTSPIPEMDTIFDKGRGKKWFAKLDLRQGYFQMMVEEDSIPYTAWVTQDSHKENVRLPQGVKNGPPVFNKAIRKCFKDLIDNGIMESYFDDIIIYGETDEDMVKNVRAVFKRCAEKKLRIKASKCVLGSEIVSVLGYTLSSKGRGISDETVAAVKAISPPRNVKEVRMFLGKVNFLRDFIPHCSEIAAPLSVLTENNTPFTWTEKENAAFEELKKIVCDQPTLVYIQPTTQLVMQTDASGVGVGEVLLSRENGVEKPICYFSHKLNSVQQRWTTIEKECYAIVYCLTQRQFSPLLKMTHFTVECDHRNLAFLDKLSESNNKLLRWKLILMEYNFDIVHIPGKSNVIADALSRLGYDLEDVASVSEMTDKQKMDIIESAHSGISGHHGVEATVRSIVDNGHEWKTLIDDVKKFVSSCVICQKIKKNGRARIFYMGTTGADQPFLCIAVDAIGPFPEDNGGNKYVIVFICCFTRWVELAAVRSTDAEEAANAFIEMIFARHGLPVMIRSDNGTQFVNDLIDKLLRRLNVKHHNILPYRPQSNGIVERANGEILKHLRMLMLEFGKAHSEWKSLLPIVSFIVNNTIHSATGASPHDMLYGNNWHPIGDIITAFHNAVDNNTLMKFAGLTTGSRKAAERYMEMLEENIRTLHRSAIVVQKKHAQVRMDKANAGKQKAEEVLREGDYVLMQPNLKEDKMQPTLLGPYKVVAFPTEFVVRIQSLVNPSIKKDVHGNTLVKLAVREGEDEKELQKMAIADVPGEYKVYEIRDHKYVGKKQVKTSLRFLVHWSGTDDSADTWEPAKNLSGCVPYEDYLDKHEDIKHVVYPDMNVNVIDTNNHYGVLDDVQCC